VPITEAMQMTVNSEIENRMDESNSTDARHVREPQLTVMPSVETVILQAVEVNEISEITKAGFQQKDPPCYERAG